MRFFDCIENLFQFLFYGKNGFDTLFYDCFQCVFFADKRIRSLAWL